MEPTFDQACADLRAEIGDLTERVGRLATHPCRRLEKDRPVYSEMIANTRLAYRHLEDARMRLGKAIQAFDGGTSVYDR